MKVFHSFLIVCLGIVGLMPESYGFDKKNSKTKLKNIEKLGLSSDFYSCSRLMELEGKAQLTNMELQEGIIIHNLLKRVAESPLDYCENIHMASSWIDGGTDEILSQI